MRSNKESSKNEELEDIALEIMKSEKEMEP